MPIGSPLWKLINAVAAEERCRILAIAEVKAAKGRQGASRDKAFWAAFYKAQQARDALEKEIMRMRRDGEDVWSGPK